MKSLDVDCWYGCGEKGGSCPEVCGVNGWCCKKDFTEDDCPSQAREVSTAGNHSCVTNLGKGIWILGGGAKYNDVKNSST